MSTPAHPTPPAPAAEWNPRYAAYALAHDRTPDEQLRHDHEANAFGYLEAFMTWLSARWAEWRKLRGLPAAVMGADLSAEQVADFDAWLGEPAAGGTAAPELQREDIA